MARRRCLLTGRSLWEDSDSEPTARSPPDSANLCSLRPPLYMTAHTLALIMIVSPHALPCGQALAPSSSHSLACSSNASARCICTRSHGHLPSPSLSPKPFTLQALRALLDAQEAHRFIAFGDQPASKVSRLP
eukprot:593789-Rhodomonas_salina.2